VATKAPKLEVTDGNLRPLPLKLMAAGHAKLLVKLKGELVDFYSIIGMHACMYALGYF
jgi:hypothetical protein